MRNLLQRARNGDSGAVAIIVAITATVLFGFGALSVDIGNAWARKRLTQTDADLAALAGADKLNGQSTSATLAITAAWTYLKSNLPNDDSTGTVINPLSAYQDGDTSNGEITVSTDYTQMTVVTQPRRVAFGIANAIGFSSVNVQATATAAIRSPHYDTLPMFLDTPCSWGSQVVKFGSPGQSTGSGLCQTSKTGDFGQLNSPVQNGSIATGDWLPINLAQGLDHPIAQYPNPVTPDQTCGQNTAQPPITDGIYDVPNPTGTPNCVDIYNGNVPGPFTVGLISGGTAIGPKGNKINYTGRLKKDTNSNCPAPQGGLNPTTTSVDNGLINNDTLDCYFASGNSMLNLATSDATQQQDVLLQAVMDTPRFFVVPVLDTTGTPQNGIYPIVGFRGAFITNETITQPATTTASDDNGLSYQQGSGNTISSVRIYAFSLNALPAHVSSHGGSGPYLGVGPTVAVLIK